MEKTYLNNGRFLHSLNGWTANDPTVVYSAGDGDDHYGIAVLPTGNKNISQSFAVEGIRVFTLHLAIKPIGAALTAGQATVTIKDGDGNTVVSSNLVAAIGDAWQEQTLTYGLAEGTTYEIIFENVSATGNIKIDDVWLWFVPITRTEIATRVHTKLGALATDRSYSPTPAGALTEGSYTYAIDAALRSANAIDPETGLPDVRWVDQNSVQTVIDYAAKQMYSQAQGDLSVLVDTTAGPYSQSLSQKFSNVSDLLGGGDEGGSISPGPIQMRKMNHD